MFGPLYPKEILINTVLMLHGGPGGLTEEGISTHRPTEAVHLEGWSHNANFPAAVLLLLTGRGRDQGSAEAPVKPIRHSH